MRVGIHQPMYLPWLGLLDRIAQCDLFILLDNVCYSKNYFLNRNKIKTATGWIWLTIPVLTKGDSNKIIKDVEIDNKNDWCKKHWMSLYYSYKNSPYYNNYSEYFENYYQREWRYLVEAISEMMHYLLKVLNIKTRIIMASSLGVSGKKEDLILNICNIVQADEYLSGPDGRNYLNLDLWEKNKIRVVFHEYQHPAYRQLHGNFMPLLSVIDLLFNCGPESLGILRN